MAGLGQSHNVLDGDPAPKGAQHPPIPHFSAHAYCSQTAGWIKMPLSVKIALSPGHIVLDGDPSPPKRDSAPIFSQCLLWRKGWMDQHVTW